MTGSMARMTCQDDRKYGKDDARNGANGLDKMEFVGRYIAKEGTNRGTIGYTWKADMS